MTSRKTKHGYAALRVDDDESDGDERPKPRERRRGRDDATLARQLRKAVWPLVVNYWGPGPTRKEAWAATAAVLLLGFVQVACLLRLSGAVVWMGAAPTASG